jgi:drug/metabolite transporter (DMT)-like permease
LIGIYPAENDMAILFALLSALFIGLNTIVIKKILSRTTPFYTATILTFIGMVFFWILVFLTLPRGLILLNTKADIYFIIAGIFAPALLRWIFLTSMERVGVSISSSILATIPAFASILAILFLDEQLTLALAAGVVLVVSGIIIFERDKNSKQTNSRLNRKDLLIPFMGALSGAVAITFRKQGLLELNSPVLGSALGFSSAMAVYIGILALSPKQRKDFTFKPGEFILFIIGGLSLAIGWLCTFYALSHGDVILVAPLSGLHPLVVLVLSAIFLKDVERITTKTVLGCASVLLGVAFITIW